ncbi:MAG TPA: glycosyl hydrolase, partial [Verrucomicrobiae bacterium]|nr:glycosyl hydrolase [Verrucomicrobiae bacterium]
MKVHSKHLLLAAGLLLAVTGCRTTVKSQALADWPADDSPQEIGKRVAENFLARKFDFQTNPRREYVIYPEACAWYGSLTVAQLTG